MTFLRIALVKVPQFILLLVFIVVNVRQGMTNWFDIVSVPLKLALLLLTLTLSTLASILYPCIRFVVARQHVSTFCHKKLFKRLQRVHKRHPSNRRSSRTELAPV